MSSLSSSECRRRCKRCKRCKRRGCCSRCRCESSSTHSYRNGSIRINVNGGGETKRCHSDSSASFIPRDDRRLLDFLICLLNGIQPNIGNCACNDMNGNTNGNVNGSVNGPVSGNINGNLNGPVNGNVNVEYVCGNIYRKLYSNLYSNLYTSLYDGLHADISCDLEHEVCANIANQSLPSITGIISPCNGSQPTTQTGDGFVAVHSTGMGVDQWTFLLGNGNIVPSSFIVSPINGSSVATASIDPASIIPATTTPPKPATFYLPIIVNTKPTADGFTFLATFE